MNCPYCHHDEATCHCTLKDKVVAFADDIIDAIIPGPDLLNHETPDDVQKQWGLKKKLAKDNPNEENN